MGFLQQRHGPHVLGAPYTLDVLPGFENGMGSGQECRGLWSVRNQACLGFCRYPLVILFSYQNIRNSSLRELRDDLKDSTR